MATHADGLRLLGSIAGAIARPVAKTAGFAAKSVAFGGIATVGAGASAAFMVGGAAAHVGMRAWDAMGRAGMGMARHRVDIPFTRGRFGFNMPTHLNGRTQAVLGMTPFAVGGAMGLMGTMRHNWDINQAVSTGAVEVEGPQFMGATGSLTLSMYKNRNRRARMQQEIDSRNGMFRGMNLSPQEQRHLTAATMDMVI